ncbi:hypothetical protein AGMMS49587_02360 [Spirochaetia bacterium]|nr:hypothetical protein AGMMS49587_02360 [Spirochaetia bacterium]
MGTHYPLKVPYATPIALPHQKATTGRQGEKILLTQGREETSEAQAP